MTDFWIGDKVRRIGLDNGVDGARIGTIATVTWVDGDGFIGVYYPGCFDDEDGSEVWHPRFTELFQEPQHEFFNEKDAPYTLLPLPEEEWNVRYGYYADTVRDYARACVAAAVEAKDAEIETLKAEVSAQRTRADAMAGEAIKHEARFERLEERMMNVLQEGDKP